jgi:DNA modification methylase
MNEFVNKIICGESLEVLGQMPDGVFNCCISSPPYWALRDYGVDGQLGLEPTFDEYIDKLCTIYDEVRRVLRPDGTCWVNLGDTYWGGKGQSGNTADNPDARRAEGKTFQRQEYKLQTTLRPQDVCGAYPAKSLCLIPHRFAIEMVNRGWILRNVIIWSKPNPMPSSAKDRFTVDFEYVFFFVKSKRYFFEPQYEAFLTESNADRPRMGQGDRTQYNQKRRTCKPLEKALDVLLKDTDNKNLKRAKPHSMHQARTEGIDQREFSPLGRNKRTTWVIPTQPTPEAHFATFPEELVRPMVKAGCPRYVCKKCGKGREKVYEQGELVDARKPSKGHAWANDPTLLRGATRNFYGPPTFKGYADCGCNAGFKAGIVLDPFVERAEPARSRPRRRWTIAA